MTMTQGHFDINQDDSKSKFFRLWSPMVNRPQPKQNISTDRQVTFKYEVILGRIFDKVSDSVGKSSSLFLDSS